MMLNPLPDPPDDSRPVASVAERAPLDIGRVAEGTAIGLAPGCLGLRIKCASGESPGAKGLRRQADTATYRYYEIAGAAHSTVHEDIEIIPAGVFGPDPIFLEDLCQFPLNTVADGPVFGSYVLNALWERMQEQVADGSAPPVGVLIDETAGVPDRDGLGNVLGGVRLPSMEAPTATYLPSNSADPNLPFLLIPIGNLACFLSGSVLPFDDETLAALYPEHGTYSSQVIGAANALKAQGLLLQSDAQKVKQAAAQSGIGE